MPTDLVLLVRSADRDIAAPCGLPPDPSDRLIPRFLSAKRTSTRVLGVFIAADAALKRSYVKEHVEAPA